MNPFDPRWWRDDSNFAPILPRHIADRWRGPAYAAGIGLAVIILGALLHIEINPAGTAIGIALMVLVAWLLELLEIPQLEERPQLEQPATGETIRLGEVRHE